MKAKISGKTAVYGVIGDPVEHSLSPVIHNAAFGSLKMDSIFVAFKVEASCVEIALRSMRGLNIQGLNVTMPHKSTVITYLDELDEKSALLESVNTILNDKGKLRGFSTDGSGAHRALEENGIGLAGKRMVLLGTGGAGKAIAFALSKEVGEIVLLNRTPEKACKLAEILHSKFQKKVSVDSLSPEAMAKALQKADLLVNATSVGMYPREGNSLVRREWLKPSMVVMDIVYNPVETKLARDARLVGAKVISGLEMLIYQGAESFEVWTGIPAPISVMRQAALSSLIEKGD
jgi:shikimate dehydrogenase